MGVHLLRLLEQHVAQRLQRREFRKLAFFDEELAPDRRLELTLPYDALPLDPSRIHAIDASLAPAEAAAQYQQQLAAVFGEGRPVFDLILLGMGPDGHTASLFADAPASEWKHALTTAERYVSVHPGAAPHARVSLSMSALKGIDRLFLLISGERKLDILKAAASAGRLDAVRVLLQKAGGQVSHYVQLIDVGVFAAAS